MNIDLSILKDYGKVAIQCDNQEDALNLCNAMYSQHPEKMREFWNRGETKWYYVEGDPVCYAPNIYKTKRNARCMQVANRKYWEENGFEIIHISSLYCDIDMGELPISDMQIETLLM